MGLFSIFLVGCCQAEARPEWLRRCSSRRSRRAWLDRVWTEVPIGASAEGIASIATTAKRVAERNAHARQDRGRCARDRKLAGAIRKCPPHVARRDPEGAVSSRQLLARRAGAEL